MQTLQLLVLSVEPWKQSEVFRYSFPAIAYRVRIVQYLLAVGVLRAAVTHAPAVEVIKPHFDNWFRPLYLYSEIYV
jgi:hypothetical protein